MKRHALLVAAAALAARSLTAQTPSDTVELAPVVITPTRSPEALSRVTSATTVITGDELRARGTRFVLDALADVPSAAVVQIGSFGGVTSLFLRGGNSNDVKVLVDGVPLNEAGGAFDFADLTTDQIERIEIVRGPSSVTYGSDAVSGVVQIITRRGSGPFRVTAAAGAGTYATRDARATLSGGSRQSGYSIGVGRIATDGTYPFNSGYRNATLSGRVDAAPDSATDLSVTLRYAERRYRFPTDGAGAAVDSNQVTDGSTVTLGLQAGRRLSPRVEARLALGLHTAEDAFDDARDNAADTSGFAFASTRTSFTSRRLADGRILLRPADGLTLTGGTSAELESERQFSETSSNFGGGPTTDAAQFDASRHTWALYAQAAAAVRALSVDAGVRLDDNSAFGTFGTYRAGLSYRIEGTRIRASAGNAFKAPTFSENFAHTPFETGDSALRPEHSSSWDAGVEQRVANRVTVGVTWFSQQFRDLIQYVSAAPGAPTYANLAAANARGLEITAAVQVARGIGLDGSYSWLRTRVTDAGASTSPVFLADAPLIRRPTHSGRVGVRLVPREGMTLDANLAVVGSRADVDFRPFPAERVTLPRYALAEVSSRLVALTRPGGETLAVSVRVSNLFDHEYETTVGFPGRGRMLLVGVDGGI